jgi:hypothetical protein
VDVWLLGAAAVVLIAITLWIVWPSSGTGRASGAAASEEANELPPQGDRFEDQYTSATADLSAGAVAATLAPRAEEADLPGPAETVQAAAPLQAAPTTGDAPGRSATISQQPPEAPIELPRPSSTVRPRALRIGAAAALTLGGAVTGALLFARWQRRQNQRTRLFSQVKRRLIR